MSFFNNDEDYEPEEDAGTVDISTGHEAFSFSGGYCFPDDGSVPMSQDSTNGAQNTSVFFDSGDGIREERAKPPASTRNTFFGQASNDDHMDVPEQLPIKPPSPPAALQAPRPVAQKTAPASRSAPPPMARPSTAPAATKPASRPPLVTPSQTPRFTANPFASLSKNLFASPPPALARGRLGSSASSASAPTKHPASVPSQVSAQSSAPASAQARPQTSPASTPPSQAPAPAAKEPSLLQSPTLKAVPASFPRTLDGFPSLPVAARALPETTRLPVQNKHVSFRADFGLAGTKRTSSAAGNEPAHPSPSSTPSSTSQQDSQSAAQRLTSSDAQSARNPEQTVMAHLVTPPFSRAGRGTTTGTASMGESAFPAAAVVTPAPGGSAGTAQLSMDVGEPVGSSHDKSSSSAPALVSHALPATDASSGQEALRKCAQIDASVAALRDKLQQMQVAAQQKRVQSTAEWKSVAQAESKLLSADCMVTLAPRLLHVKKRLQSLRERWGQLVQQK